jgi:hypothetical protein
MAREETITFWVMEFWLGSASIMTSRKKGRGHDANHKISSEGHESDIHSPESRRMTGFLVIWDGAQGFSGLLEMSLMRVFGVT